NGSVHPGGPWFGTVMVPTGRPLSYVYDVPPIPSHGYDGHGNRRSNSPGMPAGILARTVCPNTQLTGLDYFGARYFSGGQGRFGSPDRPFVDQIPSDPQSWNLYSYVRNNPLRRRDPSGLKCVDLDGGGQGDDGLPGKPCGKGAGLDLSHGVTVNENGESSGVQVYGNAFLRGDLQSGRMDSAPGDLLLAYGAARGAFALGRGLAGRLGAKAAQDMLLQGAYGSVSRATLEAAANSGGTTIRVVTRLTQTPQAGRALSTAVGEGAEALAGAAQPGGQLFVANIPSGLISVMKQAGLVLESTTSMGAATATELRFLPQATEFVVKFFH
ncbi:MAG: hypothetical protein KIT09_24130, partial [Bryobacteraceae bacterium]|nr:hypothetical protein [Bryobacteraceae bacterium]